MAVKNALKAIEVQGIASSTITGSFQAINPAGLDKACSILRVINDSNKTIAISYDGTTDNDVIPANTVLQLPVQSNAQPNSYRALFAQGTVVYASGTAGTGSVYVAGYYQPSSDT